MLSFVPLCMTISWSPLNFLTCRQPQLLSNNTPQRLTPCFLVLALAEIFSLSSLVPLDAAFASWVEAHRSCALDYFNVLLSDWPIVALVVLSLLVFVWLCAHQQWAEVWQGTLAIVIGLFLSELLKTGFERARPSVLPLLVAGNSFPSGHVAGALLIAGTLNFLLFQQRWAVWVKLGGTFMLASLVGVITWQRLYLAHHWLSDVIGSFLLVSAWLCFVLSRPALLKLSRRLTFTCMALLACYQVFYFFPPTRFTLPSGIATLGEPVFALSFGESGTRDWLQGAWGEPDWEPAGPITWMQQGEASVEVRLPESHAYTLKLAVRPFVQSKAFACFPLEVRVNQRQVGRLLLYRGWREYALHLNPSWIVPGTNAIAFRTDAAFPHFAPDQRTVAFRHLYLFAEK